MLILGIETSCDETAAAVVKDGRVILSNIVSSQVKLHAHYGGVVPEIASRAHMENIIPVIQRALEEAKVEGKDLDAIAVTTGPGLITSLMVGVDTAKTLAYVFRKPILGVNHIEGHIYSIRIKNPAFADGASAGKQEARIKGENRKVRLPAVCLTVSGGHTMLVLVKEWGNYEVIGETIDDACGEAFDKVAKLLGLGYPGGPIVEKLARGGGRQAFSFPRPILNQGNFNFSFSGLKTAVLYQARQIKKMNKKVVQDICASFQEAAFEVLVIKTLRAARKFKVSTIILTGGVAANQALQNFFKKSLPVTDYELLITDFPTDNAAMIAGAAYPRALKKDYDDWHSLQADSNLKL